MGNRRLILILILAMNVSSIFGQYSYSIGYIKNEPIIAQTGTSTLFRVTDSLSLKAIDLDVKGEPEFINDCGIVMRPTLKKYDQLLILINNRPKLDLNFAHTVGSPFLTQECGLLFASIDDSVFVFREGIIVRKFMGSVVQVDENYVYYYLPDIDAFVDVYKVDLKDFDKEELVLPGPYSVYWVNLMPFKNGKYIACNIASRDGGISSAIYNCETKEYKILTEIDHNFVPVYFPKTETLHYLDPVKRTFTKEVSYR